MTQTSSPATEAIDWRSTPWSLPEPTRLRIPLDGTWDFAPDPRGALTAADWHGGGTPADLRSIEVPIPWQAQFEDLRNYSGVGWYRRVITIPGDWRGSTVVLHIGAADYYTEVWLDGRPLGQHEGGYLPFEFILPENSAGEAELVIKVTDPGDDRGRFPEWPFDEVPHGKQSWYGPVGGIWQSVWLERRAPRWVEQVFCTPDVAGSAVDVAIALSTTAGEGMAPISVVLYSPEGREVGRRELDASAAGANAPLACARIYAEQGRLLTTRIEIPAVRLWSPADPALYAVEVDWQQQDAADRVLEHFGMRSIEARGGRILLNGEPIYLFAALDQDYYPGTIYTPPSTEFLFDQFYKAREMGLNMLRCHIKVADPRYYQVADRMGVLVWTEVPNWANRTLAAGRRGYETFEEMVRRDWNHPSIVIWTLINEDWGIELRFNERDREWLTQFYLDAKQYDPTRLVVDNSPCFFNFHMRSDIEDFHNYYTIPDHRRKWDRWVSDLAARPYWTYEYDAAESLTEHPDYLQGRGPAHSELVSRSGEEPIVLSEFGNWGLPKLKPLFECHNGEPWWFATGFDWGAAVYPHDVDFRFKVFHLDKVFGSYDEMCEKTQAQQLLALKYEIETIRRYDSICGYVITEFTDVHWECNGLLDICRNPKLFHQELAAINSETLLIPRLRRYSYWAGETARVYVYLSHWGREHLDGCTLRYEAPELGIAGTVRVPNVHTTETVRLAMLDLELREVEQPLRQRLRIELVDESGGVLARTYEDFYVFPRSMRQAPGTRIGVWHEDPVLEAHLAGLGYEVARMPEAGLELSISSMVTPQVQDYVQRGGRALVLITNDDALYTQIDAIQPVHRAGRSWQGDWASNFNWYRQDIAFKSVPGDGRFDLAFTEVAPNYVLKGFAGRHFEADVLAGMFVGWVNDNVALAGVRRHGYGHFLLTTLNLLPNLDKDVMAVRLLHELIEHLANVP